jgi:hypothetical protein
MPKQKAVMHPVSLKATKDGSGEVLLEPESDLWNGSRKFDFHKDKHGMRKQDYHLIEFVLDDRSGDGLRFPDSPHDAMWVERVNDPDDSRCPNNESASDYEVVEPICVCDGGRRLIVRNDNPKEEAWSFTLNFRKRAADGSTAHVQWDPIIQNHNRGA